MYHPHKISKFAVSPSDTHVQKDVTLELTLDEQTLNRIQSGSKVTLQVIVLKVHMEKH